MDTDTGWHSPGVRAIGLPIGRVIAEFETVGSWPEVEPYSEWAHSVYAALNVCLQEATAARTVIGLPGVWP